MPTPFYDDPGFTLYHGDCVDILPELAPADAVITDPPYGLKFMGKGWDHGVPAAAVWRAVLDNMKPGAHLLAFGGTRTHHRLMVAIEDAGFELRDVIMWVYGSGFPKSRDVSKVIDEAAEAERQIVGTVRYCENSRTGQSRESIGYGGCDPKVDRRDMTAPATDAAKQWDGWGTALKPSWEPIIVARKPLEGTVAANVVEHGVGGLNIDACRVGTTKDVPASPKVRPASTHTVSLPGKAGTSGFDPHVGRWPANLIHDGSDEVTALFPDARSYGPHPPSESRNRIGSTNFGMKQGALYADLGSASRFFYCAKASADDRGDENKHPTVKPTRLMRYLVRLVTPPGGTVLDPFMGSGTTGKAADLEGLAFVGIDVDLESCETARRRRDPPRLSMLEGGD